MWCVPASRPRAVTWLAAALLALSGCSAPTTPSDEDAGSPTPTPTPSTTPAAPVTSHAPIEPDPEAPSGWGPTLGEIAQARTEVAGWSDARLAGAVIVGRFLGTDPAEAAALVADLHLAGLSITSENVVDEEQLRELTSAVTQAAEDDAPGDGPADRGATGDGGLPAVVGVDQEGGTVEQLRGVATEFPAFAEAGEALQARPRAGGGTVTRAFDAQGLELRDLGFTWVFGPVADVTIGPADPTIGSRSPSQDPAVAGDAVVAALAGYERAGVVPTVKHFPGHGSVTTDSHLALPEQDATLAELEQRDLLPFVDAVDAGTPAVMMSHIAVDALDPGVPASLSAPAYDLLRDQLGFEGVTITDSLGMGAVVARTTPAIQALEAGADLLLMPADTAATHATLTAALGSGELDRARVEEAATRVVALRLWQQRVAAATTVPPDAAADAAAAAAALAAAG